MGKHSNYVIQPRGKALYEDETSFGSRMLAKMGWSKGKGLGANENGTQDFIRVRYKNDIGGLGFSARDDQWTENELTFNALLKNLNDEGGKTVENGDEAVNKIKSLEEKSKKSRSRVHYQKFTRGKDLSRYSEKDLANIFGKKSLDDSYKIEKEDESNSESTSNSIENVEDSKIINTGVSIADYFKNKREQLIKKTEVEPTIVENQEEEPKKKKKSSKKKSEDESKSSSCEENIELDKEAFIQEPETVSDVPEKEKKSKKSKKKQNTEIIDPVPDEEVTPTNKIKKNTKKKEKCSSENTVENSEASTEQLTKKSKKRRLSNDMNETPAENDSKKNKTDPESSTTITTITVGTDANKFFLDAVAVEKLKYLRLEKFKDSNVANIVGYGLSKDIKLEIRDSSIVKGISQVNKYSIYANVDKMHSKQYYKSLLLRYHKKRNTFKV